jgi:hypothetical protein
MGKRLVQTLYLHKNVLIKYGKTGLLVFPLLCFMSFVPILEVIGIMY